MNPHHKQVVLFDLDHTLSDACRRDHMIPEAKRTGFWDGYHYDALDDEPCRDVVALLQAFQAADYTTMAITARPSIWMKRTNLWLVKHEIRFDELLMHPRLDWEPSAELKLEMVRTRFGKDFADHILMIFDDHPEVVKAFAAAGVTAMMVHGRSYDR